MGYALFPLILFGLAFWRFRQRWYAESKRQRQITWPEAKPAFGVDQLQLRKEKGDEEKFYVAELDEDYYLYTHGQRFRGNKLLPETALIKEEEQKTINQILNVKRELLRAKFNPEDPRENMLSVGHQSLSWTKVLIYAFFGVLIPAFFIYSIFAWSTDPTTWWSTVIFQAPAS